MVILCHLAYEDHYFTKFTVLTYKTIIISITFNNIQLSYLHILKKYPYIIEGKKKLKNTTKNPHNSLPTQITDNSSEFKRDNKVLQHHQQETVIRHKPKGQVKGIGPEDPFMGPEGPVAEVMERRAEHVASVCQQTNMSKVASSRTCRIYVPFCVCMGGKVGFLFLFFIMLILNQYLTNGYFFIIFDYMLRTKKARLE